MEQKRAMYRLILFLFDSLVYRLTVFQESAKFKHEKRLQYETANGAFSQKLLRKWRFLYN